MKKCSRCQKYWPENEFYRSCSNCKLCARYKQRISYCLNPKKYHERYVKRYVKKGASRMFGERNPSWKGDRVGYASLHEWIRKVKPKPEFCENCKIKPAYEVANISQKYKRDPNDFEWLCRKCHQTKDGRIKNLELGRLKIYHA